MLEEGKLVLYKNNPAVIKGYDKDKILVQVATVGEKDKVKVEEVKVRVKDIMELSQGKIGSIERVATYYIEGIDKKIEEAYELLKDEEKESRAHLYDIAPLILYPMDEEAYWVIYKTLKSSLYFTNILGSLSFTVRSQHEIDAIILKEKEKEERKKEEAAFIHRLKENKLLDTDKVYMKSVEAVARGSGKYASKAHKALLNTGYWTPYNCPYIDRYKLGKESDITLPPPSKENRVKVDGVAFAIDNKWSTDPDDAIMFDGKYLWVHIADAADKITFDSSEEIRALDKSSTLYLPDATITMLSEKTVRDYALGLTTESFALSFRILLDENVRVLECKIIKSIVNVKRLSYEEATTLRDSSELKPLYDIAIKSYNKRRENGAVEIFLPEYHTYLDSEGKIRIERVVPIAAHSMVKEIMLLACEAVGMECYKNNVPFPYKVCERPDDSVIKLCEEDANPFEYMDDSTDIIKKEDSGLVAQYAKLRGLRRAEVSVIPSFHYTLGLPLYSQVTSPLRRYFDLASHEQLNLFILGKKILDKDDLLLKVKRSEQSLLVAKSIEKQSLEYWREVYLLDNKDWEGEAICVDTKGREARLFVLDIGSVVTVIDSSIKAGDRVRVSVKEVDITTLNAVWQVAGEGRG